MGDKIIQNPDYIVIETDETTLDTALRIAGGTACVQAGDITLNFEERGGALDVRVSAQTSALRVIRLRWNFRIPSGTRFLGDAWERSYGDLEWRGFSAARAMPWYFLAAMGTETTGYGVRVRPNAMCFWQADEAGVTLWLDVRNGGSGVQLAGRDLQACSVVCETYTDMTPFEAARRFCHIMCTDPLLPAEPIYGSNNYYYAYGVSSHDEILGDTEYLGMMADAGIRNRPFMVIDDGWQYAHDLETGCNGGPWDRGNARFPDMKGLADAIRQRNARPGIWVRVLCTSDKETLPETWRLNGSPLYLDPSIPEVLEHVRGICRTLHNWGYELIKHDFTTFDIFGRWGFEMNPYITKDGWHFADRSKTSAEIVVNLYRTILEGASGSYVLGCNCIGHLGAGLMHLQRIGDDTSGKHWERTRNIGPNTLAFRMPQHRAFFDIDADCIGIMGTIPWEYNRQWLHLLSNSGTPFFVSAKPGLMTKEQMSEMREAMQLAAKQETIAEPVDWMETTCPSVWRIKQGIIRYDWYEKTGLFGFGFDIK